MNSVTPAVLRPKQAAQYLGIGIATFRRFINEDPTFPRPFKLREAATGIMRADLDAWLEAKRGGK